MKRRKIDICAIQETRWSGAKSKDIGEGYKCIYNGSPKTTNGVAIAVAERFRNAIAEVQRYDDRLMKIVLLTAERRVHIFSAYAPQSGCTSKTKDTFWNLIDTKTAEVPTEDTLVIAGDLNGHVGARNDGYSCHGGQGFGDRNEDGERILDFAESHNLAISNTFFIKRDSHLRTYYSANWATQIDFILVRRHDLQSVLDVKVVPSETVATQHRPLVGRMKIMPLKMQKEERTGPARTKWWKFKEKEAAVISKIVLPSIINVEDTWRELAESIAKAARVELGVTKPGRRKIDKMTWLWTEDVKDKVREKKRRYHEFLAEKTPVNRDSYRVARNAAKKAIAAAKAAHLDDLYTKLDTRDGERAIYRLAKSRCKRTADIEHFYGVNDENGQLITVQKKATERW